MSLRLIFDFIHFQLQTNGAAAVPSLDIPMYQWGSEGLHGPLQPCVTDPTTSVTKCPSSFPAASATATTFVSHSSNGVVNAAAVLFT